MRRFALVAVVVVVLAIDNYLLFAQVMKNRELEKRLDTLQTTVGRYISSSDPTVSTAQFRRPQNRLVHEFVLAKFLAEAVLLKADGLGLTPEQTERALAMFRVHAPECEKLNQMDQTIAGQLRPIFTVLTPEQYKWTQQHKYDVQEKIVEILASAKHDTSMAESFGRFWEQSDKP